MNAAGITQLVLGLLQVVLSNIKSGTVTKELEAAVSGIESAIASLTEVQGSPVTYQQLEGLRVEPKW